MEKLKQNYTSPRWSMEIPDCSMPMSMDTYSRCSYNCLYCFSFFQKSHTTKGYLTGQPRSVNPEKVIALFENAAVNNTAAANKTDVQFFKYIQDRRIMQWGGLADEFDEYERRNGVTLELLRYFDKIDYPLSFSTKAAWWTEDSRYMELFARHTHNWHVKISIITADPEKARKIERGVPSPQERLAAIKRLADIGIHVTLRLRPFIIGCSEDYPALIRAAKEAGADIVFVFMSWGTEFATQPTNQQYEIADFLFENGADIIIGGHCRVPQPMELRTVTDADGNERTGFICYSLGNMLSCQNDEYTDISALVNIQLTKDTDTGETWISDVSYKPIYMADLYDYGINDYGWHYRMVDLHAAINSYESGSPWDFITDEVYRDMKDALDAVHEFFGADLDSAVKDAGDTADAETSPASETPADAAE